MNLIDNIHSLIPHHGPPEGAADAADASRLQKEQFARDFESVFLEKLLEEMKNTIGDWGFEQDAASKQIQGLFWLHLARDLSGQGGMGMWKDIYQSLNRMETETSQTNSLDKTI